RTAHHAAPRPGPCAVGPRARRHAAAGRLSRRPARGAGLRAAPGPGEARGPEGLRVRARPPDPRSVHLARRRGRLPLHHCAGRPAVADPVSGASGRRGRRQRPPVEARSPLPRQVLRRKSRGGGGAGGAGAPRGGGAVPIDLFPVDSRAPNPEPRAPPLLQVFDTYIVFQTDSGVAIVDQHSAHERVLYEQAMRQLTGDGGPAQRLLLPLTLEFTAPELEAIDAHRELLRHVGYEVEPFSGRAVVVHTAPN